MRCSFWMALVALVLCLSLTAAAAESFSLDSKNRITEYTGEGGDVTVPSLIDGKPVSTIQRKVFMNQSAITSLRLEEGIQVLGDSATYKMSALTAVELPDSLSALEDANFNSCPLLTEITLPAMLCFIGDSCLSFDKSLRSITFTGPAPMIEDGAFRSLPADCVIYVPDDQMDAYQRVLPEGLNVQASGREAVIPGYTPAECFDFDAGKGEITLYKGPAVNVIVPTEIDGVAVTSLGSYAFNDFTGIYQVILPDSVAEIGYSCFRGSFAERVVLSDNLAKIDGDAFKYLAVQELVLPESLKEIGSEAFADMKIGTLCFAGTSVPEMPADAFTDAKIGQVRIGWNATDADIAAAQAALAALGVEAPVERAEKPLPKVTPRPVLTPTPEPTPEPTAEPTPEPTPEPTAEPTPEPNDIPETPVPTVEPTPAVVKRPVFPPMIAPKPISTPAPTAEPTPEPIPEYTAAPTAAPVEPDGIADFIAPYLGTWQGLSIEAGGMSISVSDIGVDLSLTLNADGTGELIYVEPDGGKTWAVDNGQAYYAGIPLYLRDDGRLQYGDGSPSCILFVRGEGQTAPVPALTPDPAAEISQPFMGKWRGTAIKTGIISLNTDDLGVELRLTLNPDGTGEMVYINSDGGGTWAVTDGQMYYNGVPLFLLGEDQLQYNSTEEGCMLFVRE